MNLTVKEVKTQANTFLAHNQKDIHGPLIMDTIDPTSNKIK